MPSLKISVVSSPLSVRNKAPDSCGKLFRYFGIGRSMGSAMAMAATIRAVRDRTRRPVVQSGDAETRLQNQRVVSSAAADCGGGGALQAINCTHGTVRHARNRS